MLYKYVLKVYIIYLMLSVDSYNEEWVLTGKL